MKKVLFFLLSILLLSIACEKHNCPEAPQNNCEQYIHQFNGEVAFYNRWGQNSITDSISIKSKSGTIHSVSNPQTLHVLCADLLVNCSIYKDSLEITRYFPDTIKINKIVLESAKNEPEISTYLSLSDIKLDSITNNWKIAFIDY